MFAANRTLFHSKGLVIPKVNQRGFGLGNPYGPDPNWFKTLGIVPDVIDGVSPNQIPMKIEYPKGEVKHGNILLPSDVVHAPTKVHWDPDEKALFTLAKVDPDAPSRKEPIYREWRHWLVINIPSNKFAGGEVISSYKGAGPPKGTGLHRYVFLLFRQHGPIKADNMPDDGMARASFKIRDFAAAHHLGLPVGIAAYQAENI